MVALLGAIKCHVVCRHEKAEENSASSCQETWSALLRGYEIVLAQGRGDHVKGVNLRRSLDKSGQRLQHLRIGIGVVGVGIVLVFPQTDCSHINSAGTSEDDFVLEAILFTK